MTHKATTAPVMTAFGYLFEPRRQTNKQTGAVTEKWQITPVFDQTDPAQKASWDECQAAAYQEGVEVFGDGFWQFVQQGQIKWPFRDGNELDRKTSQPKFPGLHFFNCSSGSRVPVVSRYCDPNDPHQKPKPVTDGSEYYWGMKCKIAIAFKAYKNDESWGIAAYVNGVQLWYEGDRMGFDATEEFDAEGAAPAANFGGEAPAGGPPAGGPPTGNAPPQPNQPPSQPGYQQPPTGGQPPQGGSGLL